MMISSCFALEISDLKIALDQPAPIDHRVKMISGEWVLHNGFREREIKDKLYSCKVKMDACAKYKELAKDISPEVKTYLFKNPQWTIAGMAVSFSVGIILGAYLFKK